MNSRDQPRPHRVAIPILVSFSSASFAARDFTLNLSEGGMFLNTETLCSVGTRGTMTFRVSSFDDPFTLQAEVVRTAPTGDPDKPAGLGLKFLELTEQDAERLRELVGGTRDGSVVRAIRRSIQEGTRTLEQELRRRPADQKMMLALHARDKEITALIRDGNPSVAARLLECPRLTIIHVQSMMRNMSLPTQVLSLIRKNRKWLLNEEARWLFCVHINAMVSEVLSEMQLLPVPRLAALACNLQVRTAIRSRALALSKSRGGRS